MDAGDNSVRGPAVQVGPNHPRRDSVLEGGRELNWITGAIVDAGVQIHTKIGPGLLESVYETILARELARQGFHVDRQKSLSFEFEGMRFENVARPDLVVDRTVVVEVKSVARIPLAFEKQVLTYLRILDLRVGLLLNFGAPLMKEGIKRIANRL